MGRDKAKNVHDHTSQTVGGKPTPTAAEPRPTETQVALLGIQFQWTADIQVHFARDSKLVTCFVAVRHLLAWPQSRAVTGSKCALAFDCERSRHTACTCTYHTKPSAQVLAVSACM